MTMSFSSRLARSTTVRGALAKNARVCGFLTEPSDSFVRAFLSCARPAPSSGPFSATSSRGVNCSSPLPATTFSRGFATGTRGSRGHGWYVNYRAGKGGRHLQGEYHDRNIDECIEWNDAILELGQRQVYLDVIVEPRSSALIQQTKKEGTILPPLDTLTGKKHRLLMHLAETVMPETTQNFVDLCLAESDGYKGSLLYRLERNVGLCGGDVLTNTGRAGRAARGTPMFYQVQHDPLAMWHVPGTVTMLVRTVGDIDSRFVLCTEMAPHLDGINRAFGRLNDESLAVVKSWHNSLLTRKGMPTSYDLVVVGCGLVKDVDGGSDTSEPSAQDAA